MSDVSEVPFSCSAEAQLRSGPTGMARSREVVQFSRNNQALVVDERRWSGLWGCQYTEQLLYTHLLLWTTCQTGRFVNEQFLGAILKDVEVQRALR